VISLSDHSDCALTDHPVATVKAEAADEKVDEKMEDADEPKPEATAAATDGAGQQEI
jgi:hypothetical protein